MTLGAGIAIAGVSAAVAVVGWQDVHAAVFLGFCAVMITLARTL